MNHFSEGLAPVRLKEKWGVINTKNEVIIDFNLDGLLLKPFSDGLAAYGKEYNKWGFINKKGEFHIEPIYNGIVMKFINGVAIVKFKGDKYLINKNSKKFLLKSSNDEPLIEIKEVDEGQNN